jgi:YHS domain-containing protein
MKTLLFTITLLISFITVGQSSQAVKHYNISSNKVAVEGYDLISYFENTKPKEGKKQFQEMYNGITYRFVSSANQAKFKANPTKYLPKYGAWCSFAMGDSGDKVDADPETYKIVDGELHLFYNKFFTNTLKSWNKDERNLKTKAEKNWSAILKK